MKRLHLIILALVCLFTLSAEAVLSKPMTFVSGGNGGNCNECEFIIADGDISISTVEKFRELGIEGGGRILLNSKGGDLLGAIALGNAFRKSKVDIVIASVTPRADGGPYDEHPGICESACTYAFLGGVKRTAEDGSKIGIHAFSPPPMNSSPDPLYSAAEVTNVQIQLGVLLEYTQRMGADPIIVQWASEIPNDDMRYLNPDELYSLRITWNPVRATALQLVQYKRGILARTTTTDGMTKVSLYCRGKEIRITVALPIEKPQSDPFSGSFPTNPSMNLFFAKTEGDFGDWKKVEYQKLSDQNGEYYTAILDKDAVADFGRFPFLKISIGEIRAEVEAIKIIVPTDGIPELVPLLGRNCIG